VARETVTDVWKGFADPHGRKPWTRDTLALGFSATKGVASTVIHRLADRGLLDYDEPVATYWPRFAANGKARITIRDVMSHRAGLHSVRAIARHHDQLFDHSPWKTASPRRPPNRPPANRPTTP
jgi:CubicO group peptidase (beta-lactamase class C family)